MIAMHCERCWTTPCECPRYYRGRIPTEHELNKLTAEELACLNELIAKLLKQRVTHTRTGNTTTGIAEPLSNLRPNVGEVVTPNE